MKPIIEAQNLQLGENVVFGENVEIRCESFTCGDRCYFGDNTKITCRSFEAGDYLYFAQGVEIGRGGCRGPDSNVKIGNYVGVFENTVINPSEPVEIGDYVGIGADVLIWTHGAWLDPLEGFPSSFGPVSIGSNVWLPARSIVLPGVSIGENTVIAINSVVNKSLEPGCLAGGNPAKVIRAGAFPKEKSFAEKEEILTSIFERWRSLISYKIGNSPIAYRSEIRETSMSAGLTLLVNDVPVAIFQVLYKPYSMLVLKIELSEVCEDFRDFLRRNGIKIFTGEAFESILPPHERLP